jgi:hypothetical protein
MYYVVICKSWGHRFASSLPESRKPYIWALGLPVQKLNNHLVCSYFCAPNGIESTK